MSTNFFFFSTGSALSTNLNDRLILISLKNSTKITEAQVSY